MATGSRVSGKQQPNKRKAPRKPAEVAGGDLVWERFVDKAVLKVQERMFEPVTPDALRQYLDLLDAATYAQVVEERSANRLCGLPTCANAIAHNTVGQCRISVVQQAIYSLDQLNDFCSEACLVLNLKLSKTLNTDSVYGRPLTETLCQLFPRLSPEDVRKIAGHTFHPVVSADTSAAPPSQPGTTHSSGVVVRQATPIGTATTPAPAVPPKRRVKKVVVESPAPSKADQQAAAKEVIGDDQVVITNDNPVDHALNEVHSMTGATKVHVQPRPTPPSTKELAPAVPTSSETVKQHLRGFFASPTVESDLEQGVDSLSLDEDTADEVSETEADYSRHLSAFATLWQALSSWMTEDSINYCTSRTPASRQTETYEEEVEMMGGDRCRVLQRFVADGYPSVHTLLGFTTNNYVDDLWKLLLTFEYKEPIPALQPVHKRLMVYLFLHGLSKGDPSLQETLRSCKLSDIAAQFQMQEEDVAQLIALVRDPGII